MSDACPNKWKPNATIESLKKRADIYRSIRAFFLKKDVLEVETPCLSRATVTDPFLEGFHTHSKYAAKPFESLYLQTSPEYAMKRLLAAGSGDIYQICKCFREDEIGRLHNPEFTMLEWYRIGFTMQDLVDELFEFVKDILDLKRTEQMTYQAAFLKFCNIDPIQASKDELIQFANNHGLSDYVQTLQTQYHGDDENYLKDAILQVTFAQEIEPRIAQLYPVIITHFPSSQASLAKVCPVTHCALRFEMYFKGLELANGFEELQDVHIQKQRFQGDNKERKSLNLSEKPIDQNLLGALEHGLPQCSGVALGLDRLIMLALNKTSINEVLSFDFHRA